MLARLLARGNCWFDLFEFSVDSVKSTKFSSGDNRFFCFPVDFKYMKNMKVTERKQIMAKSNYKNRMAESIYKNRAYEIGNTLAHLRQEKNLSIRQIVAQLTSGRKNDISVTLSESQYKRIENAECFMSAEILMACCQFYGVTADYILFGNTDSTEYTLSQSDAQIICSYLKWQIESIKKKSTI